MEGLLAVERMVIESIGNQEVTLEQISEDTCLSNELLMNILTNLITKEILDFSREHYFINPSFKMKKLPLINKPEYVKEEVNELMTSFVEKRFGESDDSGQLRLQKIWLNPQEVKILNAQLKSIELFISNIRKARKGRPAKYKTCEQKVILWGQGDYDQIIKGTLGA